MFTLEDVEAAVEATGLTPHAGNYVDLEVKEDCLCPASILVVAKHGKEEIEAIERAASEHYAAEYVAERLGVTDEELAAFVGGVDGSDEDEMKGYYGDGEFGPECKKAYELGLAVRKRYSLK